MRNKCFLLFVGLASVALSVFFESGTAAVSYVSNDEISIVSDYNGYNGGAILRETNIDFSVGTLKLSRNDQIRTYEKSVKHDPTIEENHSIEHFVRNYIFRIEALTYYQSDLGELRRRNI